MEREQSCSILQIMHYYYLNQYLDIQIMIVFPHVKMYQVPLFLEIFLIIKFS